MSALTSVVFGILAVVGAFGFIIFIHEMGHFLTARSVDIRCPQFAIGFGPSLFSFRWRGTNFAVRLFPLGGYVLMNGEEPSSREEDPWAAAVEHYLGDQTFPAAPATLLAHMETTPEAERNDAWRDVRDQVAFARAKEFPNLRSVEGNFHDRTIPARILVISGGVIMNFLATILILWCLSPFVGVGAFFNDWAAVVSRVVPGSPAAKAGLTSGDRIAAVDGREIKTAQEAFEAIGALPGTPAKITLDRRDGSNVTLAIRPFLAVGLNRFVVDEKGALTLESSEQHPELAGKKVKSPNAQGLTSAVKASGAKEFQVTFENAPEPTTFEIPKSFRGPRGQIGILFGVSDIRFENSKTVTVQTVTPGSPAEKAGVKPGDMIYMLGGYALVSNSEQGFGSLANPALEAHARLIDPSKLEVVVIRNDKAEELVVENASTLTNTDQLGITLAPLTTGEKLKAPFTMIAGLLASPYQILEAWFSKRYTGSEIVENMQGPVGIMTLLYQLSDNGVMQFLFFMALLNAAIGAFNLLPFPALDGARLVFLVIAGLRGGRQVDPEKEARVHMVGLMVLLCFVVVVTFGDIKRLIASHLFVM